MEGSPVRGQQKVSVVQLNASPDLQSFQTELVRLINGEFRQADVLFGLYDSDSRTFDLPAWIRTHLERHAGLQKKLEQGEMVGISTGDDAMPRPATAVRSSVVLIPVTSEAQLKAVIA